MPFGATEPISTGGDWGSRPCSRCQDFAVGAVGAALGIVLEAAEQAGADEYVPDGEDELGVLGDDVGDQEVDLGRVVGDYAAVGAAVRVDVVAAVEDRGGGFHLGAPESLSGIEDEVVALAVAVGLGYAESHARRLEDEREFCQLAAAFGSVLLVVGGVLP